ncbi:MAG TPA: RdgB/HAM1 family non-canonical purine NTP pyrophosphatase [Chitinophagaceae bacterium]
MKLIFATNNQHKVEEIRAVIGDQFELLTLKEAGIDIDIPEPHDSIEANASEKSQTIYRMTGINCFSEDTGLEVTALNGEPGVKSARYAGDGRSPDDNIVKLLSNLADKEDRSARFKTVVSVIINGKETLLEGICNGNIIHEKKGSNGFGYDPVFVPGGSDKTFAEMSMKEKTLYSHRARATQKLVAFLNNLKLNH